MSLHRLLVVCAVASAALGAVVQRSSDCPQEYLDISINHTMCMTDVGIALSLTQEDKVRAVEQHNQIRINVSVTATDMLKLVWDEDLAVVATKWAAQCTVGHDTIRSLPKLPGVHVGQNMAAGYGGLQRAIEAWRSEEKDFHYGQNKTGVVGHYTQIVNSRTILVGCGMANCSMSPFRNFQVCNYAVGQSYAAEKTPYKNGTSCGDCPDSCDGTGSLCDCGGKVCLNGGTLNINTCQCQCTKLYQGNVCQEVNCYPDEDICQQLFDKYGEDVCTYTSIPEVCPVMCGVC